MSKTAKLRKALKEAERARRNKLRESKKILKQTAVAAALAAVPAFSDGYVDPDVFLSELKNCRPQGLTGSEEFRWDYLESQCLKSLPRPGIPAEVREKAAIDKLLDSEIACGNINKNGFRREDELKPVLAVARELILRTIGEEVDYSVFESAKFSGGASTSHKRIDADPYNKYVGTTKVHVTPSALPYAYAMVRLTPLWAELWTGCEQVQGNLITTVPKKTEIDRAIAIEPDLNMYLQQAVGIYFKAALIGQGISLYDQSRNKELARLGSLYGHLATIDLASASDSISRYLVLSLLPRKWYELLDALRSPTGTLPSGNTVVWEKFSSMGNGFTFELESLIFWALAKAVCIINNVDSSNLGVYGDDIIVPTSVADEVIEVLDCVGFATNKDKTFTTGPFRESCGGHYHNGNDVTPFYVRKPIDSLPRVVWLLNSLRKWAAFEGDICDPSVWPLWVKIRRKCAPGDLLGGQDVEKHNAIASPGSPRKQLVFQVKKRKIGNHGALLRNFQGSHSTLSTPAEQRSVATHNVSYVDSIPDWMLGKWVRDPLDPCVITRVNVDNWKIKPVVKYAHGWDEIPIGNVVGPNVPLFPKEITA